MVVLYTETCAKGCYPEATDRLNLDGEGKTGPTAAGPPVPSASCVRRIGNPRYSLLALTSTTIHSNITMLRLVFAARPDTVLVGPGSFLP